MDWWQWPQNVDRNKSSITNKKKKKNGSDTCVPRVKKKSSNTSLVSISWCTIFRFHPTPALALGFIGADASLASPVVPLLLVLLVPPVLVLALGLEMGLEGVETGQSTHRCRCCHWWLGAWVGAGAGAGSDVAPALRELGRVSKGVVKIELGVRSKNLEMNNNQ